MHGSLGGSRHRYRPILAQGVVPVLEEDTPETLHRRIQEEEHELYPRTLARLFNGEIRIGQPV